MRTWEGTFEIFGREEDWPEYNGDKIIPDRTLVKKGKKKVKMFTNDDGYSGVKDGSSLLSKLWNT
jgi:hypothetical protein